MNWYKQCNQNSSILQYWDGIIESQISQFDDLSFMPNMSTYNGNSFSFTVTSKVSPNNPYIISCVSTGNQLMVTIIVSDSMEGERQIGPLTFNIIEQNDTYKVVMNILSVISEDIKRSITSGFKMNWFKKSQKTECKGWMAVRLSKKDSKRIQDWGKKHIPDELLCDNEREEDTHITLAYGICADDPSIIKKVLADEKTIKATLGKVGFFMPDDKKNVVIVKVDSPDLEELHKKIKKILNIESTFDDYKPHCTIAYIKDGNAMRYAGDTFFDGTKLVFDKVVFKNNKGEETEITLK